MRLRTLYRLFRTQDDHLTLCTGWTIAEERVALLLGCCYLIVLTP
jgi:hypothetical protein